MNDDAPGRMRAPGARNRTVAYIIRPPGIPQPPWVVPPEVVPPDVFEPAPYRSHEQPHPPHGIGHEYGVGEVVDGGVWV